MSLITRTYTFTDGTTAYGSQVESEISNIATILNNVDSGSQALAALKVTGVLSISSGSAAAPSVAITGDTTTGLHQVSAGVLGVSTLGSKSAAFISTGTTNATTYSPMRLYSSSNFLGFDVQRTTGVTTGATTIMSASNSGGGLFIIYGVQTAGGSSEFSELVISTPGGSRTVIGSSVIGAPDTRTYTWSSSNLQLAMGGNTYRIHAYCMAVGNI